MWVFPWGDEVLMFCVAPQIIEDQMNNHTARLANVHPHQTHHKAYQALELSRSHSAVLENSWRDLRLRHTLASDALEKALWDWRSYKNAPFKRNKKGRESVVQW